MLRTVILRNDQPRMIVTISNTTPKTAIIAVITPEVEFGISG